MVDFRLLKFYIQHGLILRKIHQGIKYHQRLWMKPYITLNQEMREQAKTPFEKEVFKLMNNSVFGKTCENQKKRTSIQLVTNEQKFRQLVRNLSSWMRGSTARTCAQSRARRLACGSINRST